MQPNDLIGGPRELLMLALAAGAVGGVLFFAANRIMKSKGMNIEKQARETSRYRDMDAVEQMRAVYSDSRNIPLVIGAGGMLLLIGAAMMALGAGVWLVIRMASR